MRVIETQFQLLAAIQKAEIVFGWVSMVTDNQYLPLDKRELFSRIRDEYGKDDHFSAVQSEDGEAVYIGGTVIYDITND